MEKSRPIPVSLLLAAALLTMIAVLVITLVPLAPCRNCLIQNAYEEQLRRDWQEVGHGGIRSQPPPTPRVIPPRPLCRACGNTGTMTLLKKWLVRGP